MTIAFVVGALIGIIFPAAYLLHVGGLLGVSDRWAEYAFYPGFQVGIFAYNLGADDWVYHLAGFAANSLAYGVAAVVVFTIAHSVRSPWRTH